MGLFGHKQQPDKKAPIDETSDGVQKFFDGYFAELRTRGHAHFEKTLEENAEVFKQDLDATIAKADTEIKAHIAKELDRQVAEHDEIMKEAQEQALQSLTSSAKTLQEQHEKLGQSLHETIAAQQALFAAAFEENKTQIAAMKDAQASALAWLNQSAQAMQAQQQEITATLQKNVTDQQEVLVNAFEKNMAQIIEHYLLGALGDQYDLKTQLPSIIQQMEANKHAIVDDMKL